MHLTSKEMHFCVTYNAWVCSSETPIFSLAFELDICIGYQNRKNKCVPELGYIMPERKASDGE